MLVDAANVYDENELAVRLRTMHLLYESVKNSGGTVVIPSAYSEGFADAGLDRALDSLKTGKQDVRNRLSHAVGGQTKVCPYGLLR